MNKIILLPLFLLSSVAFSQIPKVVPGQNIKAEQINQIIDELIPIGTVIQSVLTPTQFSQIKGTCWKLMDGSSMAGSDLATLTNTTNVPNAMADGSFLRQAKAGRTLGTTEGDAIRNITGIFGAEGLSRDTGLTSAGGALYHESRAHGAYGGAGYSGSVRIGFDASRVVPTSDENRPKNIAVNFFIKISKTCSF